VNGENLAFAYQGIAGVAAQLDDNWAVTADYRYVGTPDQKFHTSSGAGAYAENTSHNIVLGIRYSFGEPTPPPPMHAAAPPPRPMVRAATPPAVAPIPQSFMVFFDFNKSVLTPEAKRILASAAQEYKKGGYVKIVVTGHTDTVGSIPYNQKLSERRAAAVKAELVKLGLAPTGIQAVGAGKNGLLVPTADGVREAQNRRAEIVFDKQ
jgi:outer membrane protein OmpA-like peptidoglycan-associated protein